MLSIGTYKYVTAAIMESKKTTTCSLLTSVLKEGREH